jgi:hypothetical protein
LGAFPLTREAQRRGLGVAVDSDIDISIEKALGKIKCFEEVNAKFKRFLAWLECVVPHCRLTTLALILISAR